MVVSVAQDKRKLLQTWVAEGENRQACESRVVISKESAQIYRGEQELISIYDMINDKKWPAVKIQGIIARGGGVPDPDAPNSPELVQFWCSTKKSKTDEEASRQRSETHIAAETTPEGIGALMRGPAAPIGSAAVSQQQLDAILASTRPPEAASGLRVQISPHFWVIGFCMGDAGSSCSCHWYQ